MSGRGAVGAGVILIAIGALFLAREIVPAFDASRLWPAASVVLGVVLVALSVRPRRPGT